MKHMKEAKQLYMLGDSKGAFEILEGILALSPKNTDALALKAKILDSWGYFDDSLKILQKVVNYSQIDDENAALNLDRRLQEDRDALIYSKLTPEGRWYFSFSPFQIFIAVFGLAGCILFLISSPLYFQKQESFLFLGISFFVMVLLPWLILFILHFQGVKKILIGTNGIAVFQGFKKRLVKWEDISRATITYDPDLTQHYLKLQIHDKKTDDVCLNFNISAKKSDIFARRHFLKTVIAHVPSVTHVARAVEVPQADEVVEAVAND